MFKDAAPNMLDVPEKLLEGIRKIKNHPSFEYKWIDRITRKVL